MDRRSFLKIVLAGAAAPTLIPVLEEVAAAPTPVPAPVRRLHMLTVVGEAPFGAPTRMATARVVRADGTEVMRMQFAESGGAFIYTPPASLNLDDVTIHISTPHARFHAQYVEV